jgi:hypothetical protein
MMRQMVFFSASLPRSFFGCGASLRLLGIEGNRKIVFATMRRIGKTLC